MHTYTSVLLFIIINFLSYWPWVSLSSKEDIMCKWTFFSLTHLSSLTTFSRYLDVNEIKTLDPERLKHLKGLKKLWVLGCFLWRVIPQYFYDMYRRINYLAFSYSVWNSLLPTCFLQILGVSQLAHFAKVILLLHYIC